MAGLTPIALFAYRRPQHLRRTVESLLANVQSAGTVLYAFSDAARSPADAADVSAVRAYLSTLHGFARVEVVEREKNLGLAHNIIDGVGQVLAAHESVIVLEDDLLLSPHFLRYMNDGLHLYRDDLRVASIHGYIYPVTRPLPETFFLRGADCWGWATWRDRWAWFNPDGHELRERLRGEKLDHEFDLDGAYGYSEMLDNQITGRNDSWAIRWHASCFLRGALTLYPGQSLVSNIGVDGITATHMAKTDVFDVTLAQAPVNLGGAPVREDRVARGILRDFFLNGRQRRRGFWERLDQLLRRWSGLTRP